MRAAAIKLPGTNRVRSTLASGKVTISWYRGRFKGAALLARFEGATIGEALRAEAQGIDQLVAAYHQPRVLPNPDTVKDLIIAFKVAPEGLLKMREGTTQAKWRPWLDVISAEFGDLPVTALKAKGVRREFIGWRNGWADKPRTADYGMQVLKRLLSWALDQELIEVNPAAGIAGIYSNNRADVIVEPSELKAICAKTSRRAAQAFRLAACTGIRRGDLVTLILPEVSDFSIEREANKSTSGRRMLVPLIQDARDVLAELREDRAKAKVPSTYVLTSRIGPWTPDGLTSAWVKACKAAGVEGKTLHDLRGTAVTRFCLAGLDDQEIADVMAWEPAKVRRIRRRYVDREKIARGIVARLERAEKAAGAND